MRAHWHLTLPDSAKAQVKHLANPAGSWVNEHIVRAHPDVTYYALVLFEAFAVTGVLILPTPQLGAIHTRWANGIWAPRSSCS
ncbi:hypothetical protein DMB66_58435 [Actinoplanes sp. ATCC 53533]|uniref:hypothetical protein n=1 Tax=Actinoplanes sp. ATCC 53533 TaxID=1288362 RepID=UPI000F78C69D|nr:hypothetical protein [Actinoplanes sp. ATCC 53533]RSM39236.1 hypothetical protein DMB66_58435 [Actinoplanes sp. ATCC 53533]